jgi:hypothetical protein
MDLAQLAKFGAGRSGPPQNRPAPPLVPLVLYAVFAGSVLGLEALAGLGGDPLVVAPVSLALLGLVQAVRRWDVRRRLRAQADAWIQRGYENRAASRYGWRIDELTGARERRLLAGSVRAVVEQLSERRSLGAVPLNRIGLRPCRSNLVALADRLEALERPVSPSGILAVQRLLTEPGSVLYAPSSFDERPLDTDTSAVLGAILQHLEVRP